MALRDILLNGVLRAGAAGARINAELITAGTITAEKFNAVVLRRLPPDPQGQTDGYVVKVRDGAFEIAAESGGGGVATGAEAELSQHLPSAPVVIAIPAITGSVTDDQTQAAMWSAWTDLVTYTIPAGKDGIYSFDGQMHVSTDFAPGGGSRYWVESRIRRTRGAMNTLLSYDHDYPRNFDTASGEDYWTQSGHDDCEVADVIALQVRVRRQANIGTSNLNTVAANATFAATANWLDVLRHPVGGSGRGVMLGATAPEPVDTTAAVGTATTAAPADHKHNLDIGATGDVRGTWANELLTLLFNNSRLRDFGDDLSGFGYTLTPDAISQSTWAAQPTQTQLTAAEYKDFFQSGPLLNNQWYGVRLTAGTALSTYAELRIGGTDGRIIHGGRFQRIPASQMTVIAEGVGGFDYYTIQLPDFPAGSALTFFQHTPLTLDTNRLVFNPPFAHQTHLPDLVTVLPFEPTIGHTVRISGVVNYPVTVEMTVAESGTTGLLYGEFDNQTIGTAILERLNIYTAAYAGPLSSLRNDRVFAEFQNQIATAGMQILVDGTAHDINSARLAQPATHEHEVPTLNPEDLVAGTYRVQFIVAMVQSPADRSIGIVNEVVQISYAGEDRWNFTGSAPLDDNGRVPLPFMPMNTAITQAQYDALVAASNTEAIVYLVAG